MSRSYSPIALFVYNRPEHTRRTLEALRNNEGAAYSKLIIFSDGPKDGASCEIRQRIAEVRELIRRECWCGDKEIIEADTNLGLAQSICRGVGSLLERYDRIIVLEDDIETSRGFINYMNDALELYRDEADVYQVTGFMVPNRWSAAQTGFLRVISSWGWGTWKRAWQHFEPDSTTLFHEVQKKGRAEFDLGGVAHQFYDLERNSKKEIDTWAVKWYASVFLRGGLCLYPKRSLVRNIGLDGSGVHCGKSDNYRTWMSPLARKISVKRMPVVEDPEYLAAMRAHYVRLYKRWTGLSLKGNVKSTVKRVAGSVTGLVKLRRQRDDSDSA